MNSAIKSRNGRERMSRAAALENAAPARADGLSGDSVDLDVADLVEADTVYQAECLKSVCNIGRLCGAICEQDAVKLTGIVQEGDGLGVPGEGVVGLFAHDGEYFWIDAQGCFSVDQLCAQGRLLESEKGAFAQVMKFVSKFILRGVEVAA